jgi:hypothetical protein
MTSFVLADLGTGPKTDLELLVAVLVAEVVVAVMAYHESDRFRQQYGTTPWGLPSLLWAFVGFASSVFSGILLWRARVTTAAGTRAGVATSTGPAGTEAAVAAAATGGRAADELAADERAAGSAAAGTAAPHADAAHTARAGAAQADAARAGTAQAGTAAGGTGAPGSAGLSTEAHPGRPRADWYVDPVGRHELRYWDGGSWTKWVSDVGTTAEDPLSASD